jgi:hypothetical protein
MLDPNERHVYLEALKPPDGYALGEAVATTYSLDLQTPGPPISADQIQQGLPRPGGGTTPPAVPLDI